MACRVCSSIFCSYNRKLCYKCIYELRKQSNKIPVIKNKEKYLLYQRNYYHSTLKLSKAYILRTKKYYQKNKLNIKIKMYEK